MYGQGNCAPQHGKSPHRPPRPPFLQQVNHPPASAGHFHQGPPVPSPAAIQPAVQPPQLGPPNVSAYQYAPAMPPPLARPYMPNSFSSVGQFYLPPPPTGHGSSNMMHQYSSAQQHPQSGVQSAQYISPSHPPLGHSGVLPPPPPPPQIQNLYTPPPASTRPPPPPMLIQSYNMPSPSTFHSVAPSTGGETNTGSAVSQLPPLPPSSPPLPPPPPPFSTTPSSKPMGLDLSTQSLCDSSSNLASFSVSLRDKLTESQNRENIQLNHSSDREPETECVNATPLEGDLSSKQSVELDLPPPPPRPTSENTLRNIEILCQFISKNGPDFEDMVRQKEAENPEFIFLFGGEVGSEAAIAQEYYLWMKDRSCLEYGLLKGEKRTNLSLTKRCAENTVEHSIREAASCAWSDSDMDMEDDTNQPSEELPVGDHVSDQQQDSIPDEVGIQEPKKYNLLQTPGGGISTVKLGPPMQLGGDVGGKTDRTSGSVIVTDSPIKLLKEYASDDDSEDDADACATVDEQAATLQIQKAVPMVSDECIMRDSDEPKAAEVGPSGSLEGCGQPTDHNSTLSSEIIVNKMISAPSSLEKKSGQDVDDIFRTDSPRQNTSFDDFEGKGALKYPSGSVVCNSANAQGKRKINAAAVKVDEFGRLVREGGSETDSDDSSYSRRDHRRGRSRSASRSPPVKRRRSPRRRNERRSPSRSCSPKRRRSWSRSPRRRRSRSRSPFRRTIDASNKSRRGGYQIGLCFNYLKGRCYRGDSCRYRHSDPDKHGGSRHYKSKHHPSETAKSSRDYDFLEEDKTTTVKCLLEQDVDGVEMKQDEVNKQEVKAGREEHTSGAFASKDAIVDEKDRGESVAGSLQYDLLARSSNEDVTDSNKNATIEESTACLLGESDSKNVSENFDDSKRHVSPMKDDHAEHIQSESLTQEHRTLTNQPQSNTGPSSSIAHAPSASSPQLSEVMPCQSIKPGEPVGQQDALASDSSAINCSYQVSQLPPSLPMPSFPLPVPVPVPPPPQSLHVANIPHVLQPVQGYVSASLETNLPLQTAPMGNYPSYSVLLPNQHSQNPVQQNPSWSTMPAPQLCPPYMGNPPIHGGLAPFQQESLPLRSVPPVHSSLKINPTDPPSHLEAGSLHERAHPSMPDAQQSTPLVDLYLNSASGLIQSSSSHGNVPSQPRSSFAGTNSNKVQSFSHGILPPSESSGLHLHNPPYLHQRPSYELYQGAGETIGGASYISDAGNRRTAHYNPYASTFDQPLSSKFNPIMFRQEETHFRRKDENSFSFSHPSFDAQKASYGASNLIPSPISSRAGGQTLLKSGGDQYDPLFDSIDPSAGSLKKQLGPEDHAADNSDIMLRLSACEPTDVKVNQKKKELEAVAAATSFENDEFGETADVEAGVVESGSESNPIDGAKVATSDDEIDQVKTEGKSKKNKESRSMKLFRVELANFVKGMLKPSWRQGNMSKEAFKTIVKKTVEKVSGAMEGHRVPKSKAKIGQYIDRSKDKLTRLVQGYVNKYAKA